MESQKALFVLESYIMSFPILGNEILDRIASHFEAVLEL